MHMDWAPWLDESIIRDNNDIPAVIINFHFSPYVAVSAASCIAGNFKPRAPRHPRRPRVGIDIDSMGH